jgi:hypothetical protein
VSEELRSILIGTAGLSVAGGIAIGLAIVRGPRSWSAITVGPTVRLAAVAVVLQAAHFTEEFGTSFYQRFPELFGVAPWTLRFFVSFNLFWLAIWILSIWGLTARRRAAFFPLWFLAIACFVNGIAHPLLSMRTRSYFPGLFTAPLVGVIGFLLLRRLLMITERQDRPEAA